MPRYASAVLSAESFDGYSEADLVRDLLFVFQGIETYAIRCGYRNEINSKLYNSTLF